MKICFADQLFYVHQRPYSIRRVSKRFGGPGRIVRDFSKEERSIFSLKGCSVENQPIPDPSVEHPCHNHKCPHLCFAVPNPDQGSDKPQLVKRCACKQGKYYVKCQQFALSKYIQNALCGLFDIAWPIKKTKFISP